MALFRKYGWIALLWLVAEVLFLHFTDSRWLFTYLFFAPVEVFKKNYPDYWWLVYGLIKGHVFPVVVAVVWYLHSLNFTSVVVAYIKTKTRFFLLKAVYVFKPVNMLESLVSGMQRHWLVVVFAAAAFALRLAYMLITDNFFNGDSGPRLYNCWVWSVQPSLFLGFDWLPMQFYIVGSVIKLTGDVFWAPRLVSVVAGAVSVVPYYYLVRHLFPKNISILSAAFFLVRPLHVKHSVITMSEPLYILFILLAFCCFFKYLRQRELSVSSLWWCVFYISCSGMLRMESWFYQALLVLILLLSGTGQKRLWQFIGLVAVVPVFVMLNSALQQGDPLRSLNFSDVEVRNFMVLNGISVRQNLYALLSAFRPDAVFFIPLGIAVSVRNRNLRYYLLLFVVPFVLITCKMATLTLIGAGRYYLPCVVLAFPFYVSGCYWLASKVLKQQALRHALVSAYLVLTLIPKMQPHVIGPLKQEDAARFRKGFKEMAIWARSNLPTGSRLFIGNNHYSAHTWMVYSGAMMNLNFPGEEWLREKNRNSVLSTRYFPKFRVVGYVTGRNWVGEEFESRDIHESLLNDNLTHVVVFEGGVLDKSGLFDKKEIDCTGYVMKEIVNMEGNRIYEVWRDGRRNIPTAEDGCF